MSEFGKLKLCFVFVLAIMFVSGTALPLVGGVGSVEKEMLVADENTVNAGGIVSIDALTMEVLSGKVGEGPAPMAPPPAPGPRDVLYAENFNYGGSMPPTWFQNHQGPDLWHWDPYLESGSDYMIECNSDDAGSGTDIQELIFMESETIDCTDYGYLQCEFYLDYNYYNGDEWGYIMYSTSTMYPAFQSFGFWNSDTTGIQTLDMSMCDGDSEVRLAFWYHGTYDFWMRCDDIVVEGYSFVDLEPDWVDGPDLCVVGDMITLKRHIANHGSLDSASFSYQIYLSEDNIIEPTDHLLVTYVTDIPAHTETIYTFGLTLSTVYVGTYWYGIIVDNLDSIAESDETNNWAASNHTVDIDDAYEENDNIPSAYGGLNEQIWLSTVNGPGYQADNDFYEIFITTNFMRLVVDCTFTHADGNIGLAVYDPTGWLVDWVNSPTDNEHLDFILPDDGTFYILVYGGANAGNSYDLWWDDLPSSTIDVEAVSVSGPAAMTEGDPINIDVTMRNNGNLPSGTFKYGLYLSEDTAITTADTEVYSFQASGLAAGETLSGFVPTTLPAGLMGIYYYGLITDINGEIAENNEVNNVTRSPSTVKIDDHYEENDDIPSAYDYTLNEMQWLSSNNGLGCSADEDYYEIFMTTGFLDLTVQCQFTHADGDIGIAIYTSEGTLIDWVDSITDNEFLNCIAPNAGKMIIRVYGDLAGNTYDLWWDDTISPPYIDLVATSIGGPTNANEGEAVSVDSQMSNFGNTVCPSYDFGFYLSWNPIISTGDTEIYSNTFLGLGAGVTDTRSTPVTLPAGLIGRYYYGLIMDVPEAVNENNETNNVIASSGTILIDDAYEENDNMASAYDISGNEMWWLDTIDGYGLQADPDWYEIFITNGYNHLLVDVLFSHGQGNIDVAVYNSTGALLTVSNSVTDNEFIQYTLPETTGTFYLCVYGANGENTYNLWWDDIWATYDLVADEVSGPVYTTAGSTINIYREFSNPSNTDSGTFTYGLYLSDDATITTGDTMIYETTISLGAELMNFATIPVALAPSIVGRYYYGLIVDVYNDESEDNEANNAVASLGTVIIDDAYEENDIWTTYYDLASNEQTWLSTILSPGLQADDDWYRISMTVGYEHLIVDLTFTHSEGNIDLAVYDSTGSFVTSSFSSTDNEYLAFTLPSSGIYYLRVYGDDAENVYDLWWDDIPPTVDLVATMVSGPAMCNEGDTIDITRLMENNGNTISLPFTYEFYLSDDNVITTGDTLIYQVPRGPIQPGSFSLSDVAVTLPAGMIGTYYYGLMVDTLNENTETNEGNNVIASLGTVLIDDAYEDNDDLASAYDLISWDGWWLSGLDGYGIQADDDLYLIEINPAFEWLYALVTFNHSEGDIDLEVLDITGKVVAGSYSATDNETLEVLLPVGQYYLKVCFSNAGNQYDLWWDGSLPPSTATVTGPVSAMPENNQFIDIEYTTENFPAWIDLWYTTDTAEPYIWNYIGRDNTPFDLTYPWMIPTDGSYAWFGSSNEEEPPTFTDPPEAGYYEYDGTAPWVTSTTPADWANDVSTAPGTFTIYFNEDMLPVPEPLSNLPGITWIWNTFTELEGSYGALDPQSVYIVDLAGQGFIDMAYNSMTGDDFFEFTTVSEINVNEAALSDGWILVSFPNQIEGDPLTLLVDLYDDGAGGFVTWDIVQYFDAKTGEWLTTSTFKPPSLNTFNYVNNTMAFWMHVTDFAGDGLLNLGGNITRWGEPATIYLYAGWNLIGCPFPTSQPAMNSFGTLSFVDDMECYDPSDPYRLRFYNMFVEDHEPGKGYWVHVTADEWVVWTCP